LEESRPTMSEDPKPVLPLRVAAFLTVSPSLRVKVLARADALQIRAPFGDLTIPYALITAVTKESPGGIRMNLAGATLRLDNPNLPDMVFNYLVDLLQHGGARAAVADANKRQAQHAEHG
jgi:hypothetical protein